MHSKIAGLLAHLLCAAVPQNAQDAPPQLPWAALPAPADGNTQIEIATLFRDLRALRAYGDHLRDTLREVPVGVALVGGAHARLQDPTLTADGAPDLTEQLRVLDDWLDLASPGDDPVPATLAWLSSGDDFGWEGAIKLSPGVTERLTAHQATAVQGHTGVWMLTQASHSFYVRQDEQGWLRVAAELRWLGLPQGGVPQPWLTSHVHFDGADMAMVAQAGGVLARRYLAESPTPGLHTVAQYVRAGGFAWRFGDGQTTQMRLVVDAPAIEALRGVLASRQPPDVLAHSLGDDVQSMSVWMMPEAVKKMLPMTLTLKLQHTAAPVPARVKELLTALEGHVALSTYDAPSDWALAVRFQNADAANLMVDQLRLWARTASKAYMNGGQQVIDMEPLAGTVRGVLHLQPAPHLEGPYVAAHGATLLLVQQRSRLQKLLAIEEPPLPALVRPVSDDDDSYDEDEANTGLFAMPLTPLMREALAGNHMLSTYHILGGDAGWLSTLAWMANRAQVPVNADDAPRREPIVTPAMARTPQWMGALGYLWLCSYDLAATADIRKSALVVDFTRSEL